MPEPLPPRPASSETARARVIFAFDYGLRRIGVACGDTISRTASPLQPVASGPKGPQWDKIAALLRDWQPDLAVVGLPYNVDGSETGMAGAARSFAAELQQRHAIEVAMVDERYSSQEAGARLKSARESGLRRRKVAKADIDAAAACVILERWFTEQN
jgi:putative Holliday junction resolvase